MADVATPPAGTMSAIDAGAEPTGKPQKAKPEKPDEQRYKEDLAKAEKEHTAAQEKVVRLHATRGNVKLEKEGREPIVTTSLCPPHLECDQSKD